MGPQEALRIGWCPEVEIGSCLVGTSQVKHSCWNLLVGVPVHPRGFVKLVIDLSDFLKSRSHALIFALDRHGLWTSTIKLEGSAPLVVECR